MIARLLAPLWAKLALAALVLVLIGAAVQVITGHGRDRALVRTAREAGQASAAAAQHETTLGQLKEANDAEHSLRSGGERDAERYAQCLQDSDRPAACARYRPVELVPGR